MKFDILAELANDLVHPRGLVIVMCCVDQVIQTTFAKYAKYTYAKSASINAINSPQIPFFENAFSKVDRESPSAGPIVIWDDSMPASFNKVRDLARTNILNLHLTNARVACRSPCGTTSARSPQCR